jgi:alpha-galactosidase
MEPIIIALIGAGSRSFGPETVRDVLLSEALAQRHVELRLMDILADNLLDIGRYAKSLVEKLGRNAEVSTTTAFEGAQFVVTAVEVGRSLYWAQDFHIPCKYGSARSLPRTAGQLSDQRRCFRPEMDYYRDELANAEGD